MKADTASLSKTGGRKTNQDACGFREGAVGSCWVVADGLGGHAGGETASRMAVDVVLSFFQAQPEFSREGMTACFAKVQKTIQDEAAQEPLLSGMRTTLVVLACSNEGKVVWGHVGDSRLYLFRHGNILHQTRDHSVPQMLVDAGKIKPEEIRGHEDQNRLTRAVGQDGVLHPTILSELILLEEGDAALLCSDGIWTWVLEEEMEADLQMARSADAWLAALEKRVGAGATGQYDNYTAIAVLFSRSTPE